MPPRAEPEPTGLSLFHVIGRELLNPVRGVAVEKLDKRLAPMLRTVRSLSLDASQLALLDTAFTSYAPPTEGTIDANLDLIESAAFLSADKNYILSLRNRPLSTLTDADYKLVATIVENAPKLLPIDRLRSSIDSDQMAGMMEYFAGDTASMGEFAKHLTEMGGSESFTNILVTDPGEKHGYKGWLILRNGYPHVLVPNYRGLPEGINLLNPEPKDARIARIIRACQFHVSNICRPGIPNRSRYEFSVRAFGAEGADAPELFNLLPAGIRALGEYRTGMLGSTEKEVDHVPAPTENGIQAVLSAFHKPVKVVEDCGPLLDADKKPVVLEGKEVRDMRESGFMIGAGELFAMFEGDRKLEVKRDDAGYTVFRIGDGPEMTMKEMTPEQRKDLLVNPDVQTVFANENDVLFGRHKFGENVATNPNINQERDGLEGMARLVLDQLKKNGVQLDRVVRFGEVHVDGQELTINHPSVREYMAQHPDDLEAGAMKMMVELLVSLAPMKNSALDLGEVTQLSWLWDLARKRNLFSPEIADKGYKRWIYDEAYDNNPNVFRPLAQPMGNLWPAWKKGNCDWFTIAEEGNPLDSYIPTLNPIDLMAREIVIPPIMVNVGGQTIPLHKLGGEYEDLALTIKSIHAGTRWERSQWRTQTYHNMQIPNMIIANMVKESEKPNPDYNLWINWAGAYHNEHIKEYNTMAIQEIPADQASKLIRTNFLNQENREALAHVPYRAQVELLVGELPELPEEEFTGFFGWQRLNEADSRQNILAGQMDHIFKYLKVYPQHWKANADGLAHLVPTMNNAVDKRLEMLLGGRPEILKYQSDDFFEGLTKQWMETLFVMAGMRDQKEALGFADEYVDVYMKEVHSTMGYTGERRYENIEDIVLSCFQLKDKAAEIAWIKIKGSGKGVELDDTPLLELNSDKIPVVVLAKIQKALTAGDWSVVFPFMADPRDFIGNLIKDKKLDKSFAITGNENQSEMALKLQAAVDARMKAGNQLVKPYVRFGAQIQQQMEMKTDGRSEVVVIEERDVLKNYGLKSNPEKLHYLRILNQIEDKLAIPQDIVDAILVRMGSSKEEYQEAINMQAGAIEERLHALEQRMIERARQLAADEAAAVAAIAPLTP